MRLITAFILGLILIFALHAQTRSEYESRQTAKYLGVTVEPFPMPQGLAGYDNVAETAAPFKFNVTKRPLTGPTPRPSYEPRPLVKAKAPDGAIFEAYCGTYDLKQVWPGPGKDSSNMNTRQQYEPHLGYGYSGPDIFIGKRVAGRIRTQLFFRDVGSHTTAPHFISVDSKGQIHLIVSDVNISDNNELDVYATIGNPETGKWNEAMMLDRRGFTSWSHPWAGSWHNNVYLSWDWGDASFDKNNPNMGLFFVDWNTSGYGRKVRVISGLVNSYDATIDPVSGRIVVAASNEDGVWLVSKDSKSGWTRAVRLDPGLRGETDVSISPLDGGAFVIRTNATRSEFLLRPIK